MNRLNDIYSNLEENIDIKKTYPGKKLKISELQNFSTNDIYESGLPENISVKNKNIIQVAKIKNKKNIDALKKPGSLRKNIEPFKKLKFLEYFSWRYINFLFKKYIKNTTLLKNLTKKNNLLPKTFSLILLSFFILIANKFMVEHTLKSGYNNILSLKDGEKSIENIEKTLKSAQRKFIISDVLFIPFKIFKKGQVKNAHHMIQGGKYLTATLLTGTDIYNENIHILETKKIEEIYFSEIFEENQKNINTLAISLNKATEHYLQLTKTGDKTMDQEIQKQQTKIQQVNTIVQHIQQNQETILKILGHEKAQKYLIAFQNSDEIRPLGGFMGTLGMLEIFRGNIKNFEHKDVYAYEWDLKSAQYTKSLAPEGLNQLTTHLGLRDANYFIDIDTSSKSIRFFMKKTGREIDGIIYINQNILLDFLEQYTGFYFEKINQEITHENFSEIISTLVEAKVYKKGTLGSPKEILFDFTQAYKNFLLEKKDFLGYASLLSKQIQQRELFFHSFDTEIHSLSQKLKIDGQPKLDTLDFSYPVFTSLSGNKSDRFIQHAYAKNVEKDEYCNIQTNFQIALTHTFSLEDEQRIQTLMQEYNISDTKILQIQGRGNNRQYVRLVLPKNAYIQVAPNMWITSQDDKKTVHFYMDTKRGTTTKRNIRYQIENQECETYSFSFHKQSGVKNYDFIMNTPKDIFEYSGIEKDFIYNE